MKELQQPALNRAAQRDRLWRCAQELGALSLHLPRPGGLERELRRYDLRQRTGLTAPLNGLASERCMSSVSVLKQLQTHQRRKCLHR